MHKIDVGFDTLTQIFHLGDIHIRNVRRHEEYRKVFSKFYKEIDDRITPQSIIYIAGDIVHAKTEMSPELVNVVGEFLTECARRCPTVIIPGNHDFNQNNPNRLDALSPIVRFLNHPNIHYLKESGVFQLADVRFVNYSILDKPEDWPTPDSSDMYTVGMFHGPVELSETDLGFKFYDTEFTAETFSGCDLVLCGDIHRRQVIDEGGPVVVYCGSMIQQNLGETLKEHGFIAWKFKDGKLEDGDFVDLDNEHGYYTIKVKDGKVSDTSDIPKHPRIHFEISNTPNADFKLLLSELRKNHNITTYTTNRLDSISKQRHSGDSTLTFGDVTNVDVQNTILREYLENRFALEAEQIAKVLEFNRKLNTRIPEEEIVRNVHWKPLTLKFSNMFAYGEDNFINFENMTGIYGVFAPNRSGKSSIFDVILYCLFDKFSRGSLAGLVKNTKADSFECEFRFELGGDVYGIRRVASPRGKSLKVDVDFWREDGGDGESLNGDDRNGTNAVIRRYIGTYEDFVATTLSLQKTKKDATPFIDMGASGRKDLLMNFMGLGVFDKLHKVASKDIAETSTLIKRLKGKDHDSKLAEINESLGDLDEVITSKELIVEDVDSRVMAFRDKISSKKALIVETVDDTLDIDTLQTTLKSYRLRKDQREESLRDAVGKKKSAEKALAVAEASVKDVDDDEIYAKSKEFETATQTYNQKKTKARELKDRITKMRSRLKNAKAEHEYDPDCEFCVTNAKSHLELVAQMEDDISTAKSELSELATEGAELKEQIAELSKGDWNRKLQDLRKATSTLNEANKRYTSASDMVSQVKDDINVIAGRIADVEGKIEQYERDKKILEKNRKLKGEIATLNETLSGVEKEKRDATNSLRETQATKVRLETEKAGILSEIEELRGLEEQYVMYDYYLKSMHRDGIPSQLMNTALPAVEDEANNILQQISDFELGLTIDGKSVDGTIREDGEEWPMELASGMEAFTIGLALRIAFMNVCSLPRSNFLVVDEGFGTLDSHNVSSIFSLFEYMRTQFDFTMVISHLDVIRDMVDNMIELHKDGGFTHINHG